VVGDLGEVRQGGNLLEADPHSVQKRLPLCLQRALPATEGVCQPSR
jgi:hypothetical protein